MPSPLIVSIKMMGGVAQYLNVRHSIKCELTQQTATLKLSMLMTEGDLPVGLSIRRLS